MGNLSLHREASPGAKGLKFDPGACRSLDQFLSSCVSLIAAGETAATRQLHHTTRQPPAGCPGGHYAGAAWPLAVAAGNLNLNAPGHCRRLSGSGHRGRYQQSRWHRAGQVRSLAGSMPVLGRTPRPWAPQSSLGYLRGIVMRESGHARIFDTTQRQPQAGSHPLPVANHDAQLETWLYVPVTNGMPVKSVP
jgi:hypothetical protein